MTRPPKPAATDDGLPFELALLARAVNYQQWVASAVEPHLGRRILEVGAGIGNMSKWLPARDLLMLSEAEPSLLAQLRQTAARHFENDRRVSVAALDLTQDLRTQFSRHDFDTIVSFNVLEHIEDDAGALRQLIGILRDSQSGAPRRLVTFVPAHQWALGTIDRTYGHFRRYSAQDFGRLAAAVAPGCRYSARYFNLVGLPGWLVMGKLMRRPNISVRAVDSFEKLCPYIRGIDDFLHTTLHIPLGQSLLAVISLDE